MAMKISGDPRVTELVSAAEKGDVGEVKRLLAEGADPHAMPEDGTDSAVWAAVYARQLDVLRALAEAKAKFNEGWPHTPLTVAAGWGNLEMIRVLVEGGADVNRPNSSGETPLLRAVLDGKADAAAELLRLGADPNLIPRKKKYDTVTNFSPLQYAAMTGDKKLIAALCAAPGAKANKHLPALLLSGVATAGDLAEVKRLIEQDGVDVDARDARHHTPLINAAENGKIKIVRYLLDQGADVNLAAGAKSDEISPLIAAALSGKVEVVKRMVEAGADLDYAPADNPEGTALACAKYNRLKKVTEYLLELRKQRSGGAKSKTGETAKPRGPRGVTTFDTNDAVVLVAAGVVDVAEAFAKQAGAKTWKRNALGAKVTLTKRCYAVWKLADSPWSIVMKVCCADGRHWPRAADAAAISKSLEARALFVANSDTAGVTQYALFESGKLVEVFDYGSAADNDNAERVVPRFAKYQGLDMTGIPGGVFVKKNMTFASALRTVDLGKIKNDLDFVDDYVKQQDAFVPFWVEGWGEPGETAELTLEGLGPDDVERLDYIAVK